MTKLLRLVVQGFLVDEDAAGEIVNLVALDPIEIWGRPNAPAAFQAHLDAIDQLCKQRGEEVTPDASDEARLEGPLPAQERD